MSKAKRTNELRLRQCRDCNELYKGTKFSKYCNPCKRIRMKKNFCVICGRSLFKHNLSGYCNIHRNENPTYKKIKSKSTEKWKQKNKEKYKTYQRNYRKKKGLNTY